MAKKTKITRQIIIGFYMEELLNKGYKPKSIYAFCKAFNFNEELFYKEFASFESLEKEIWNEFIFKTLEILASDENYTNYLAKQKLLSFYYTFFEMLSANRSFVLMILQDKMKNPSTQKKLSGLKKNFIQYITNLDINILEIKNETLDKIKDRTFHEGAWIQLLYTIDFWINDESKEFEKSDVFIEKSINATFDLIDTTPAKSVFDLAKFLWKEKTGN